MRMRIATGLMAAGGAAVVIGVIRAIVQHGDSKPDRRSLVVQPVPIEGGAAMVATWSLP